MEKTLKKKQNNLEDAGILEKWKIEKWKNGTLGIFGKLWKLKNGKMEHLGVLEQIENGKMENFGTVWYHNGAIWYHMVPPNGAIGYLVVP